MAWIYQNLATIVVGTLLLLAVVLAIRSVVKAHRAGGCSCGCSGCSCSGSCPHTTTVHNP